MLVPITGMRPLYYPPTPIAENAHNVGLGAHADFSCTYPPPYAHTQSVTHR